MGNWKKKQNVNVDSILYRLLLIEIDTISKLFICMQYLTVKRKEISFLLGIGEGGNMVVNNIIGL